MLSATDVAPFVNEGNAFSFDASQLSGTFRSIPIISSSVFVIFDRQLLGVEQYKIVGRSIIIAVSKISAAGMNSDPQQSRLEAPFPIRTLSCNSRSKYMFCPSRSSPNHNSEPWLDDHGWIARIASRDNKCSHSKQLHYSLVTLGDLAFSLAPLGVVQVGSKEYIQPGMILFTTISNENKASTSSQGAGLISTAITLPITQPSFVLTTQGGTTFFIAPSEAVIKGCTYAIGPSMTPVTRIVDGQTTILLLIV